MVFSLFRKRGKGQSGRLLDTDPSVTTPSTIGGHAKAAAARDDTAAREAARRTAEKINQIENEVIADALTTLNRNRGGGEAGRSLPQSPAGASSATTSSGNRAFSGAPSGVSGAVPGQADAASAARAQAGDANGASVDLDSLLDFESFDDDSPVVPEPVSVWQRDGGQPDLEFTGSPAKADGARPGRPGAEPVAVKSAAPVSAQPVAGSSLASDGPARADAGRTVERIEAQSSRAQVAVDATELRNAIQIPDGFGGIASAQNPAARDASKSGQRIAGSTGAASAPPEAPDFPTLDGIAAIPAGAPAPAQAPLDGMTGRSPRGVGDPDRRTDERRDGGTTGDSSQDADRAADSDDFPSTIVAPVSRDPGAFTPGAHVVQADFSAFTFDTGALDGDELPRRPSPPAPSQAGGNPAPALPAQAVPAERTAASLFANAGSGTTPLFGALSAGSASAARLAEQADRMDDDASAASIVKSLPDAFEEEFLSFDDVAPVDRDNELIPVMALPREPVRPRLMPDDDLAIDVIDGSLPGQLEEAAILFANGQHEPTVDALKLAIEDKSLGSAHTSLAWQMLFDLYRVMGERDSFDSLAIRYASTFESSPPPWSDDLRYPERRDPTRRKASPSHVIAAGALDAGFSKYAEQLLRAASHKRQCSLDFSELTAIDLDAATQFITLMTGFAELGHPLAFVGLEQLLSCARAHTETGRPDEDQTFWQLALLTLRLMDSQERFEELSIEFCITYEVSPPPWQPMPSSFSRTDQDAVAAPAPMMPAPEGSAGSDQVVFAGDLTGRIVEAVKALRQVAEESELVKVDCKRLRRLDFSASGELLNELVKLAGAGRKVQFVEPNFLVYALMIVMGIHDVAQIRRRKL